MLYHAISFSMERELFDAQAAVDSWGRDVDPVGGVKIW